jgi:hypothetical protein
VIEAKHAGSDAIPGRFSLFQGVARDLNDSYSLSGDDSIIIAREIRRKTFAPAGWIRFNPSALLRRFIALS